MLPCQTIVLEARPSYKISMSSSPIPKKAIPSSSAAMLVAQFYTILRDRPCMLTQVTVRRLHDIARDVHVAGVDLETGEKVEATLGKHVTVSIASKSVGEFVPTSLLGPGSVRVAAASVMEGCYMVIEGRVCKIGNHLRCVLEWAWHVSFTNKLIRGCMASSNLAIYN